LKKKDFVVRFAGEGGQGVVTSAEGLAQAMAQSGYHVQTFSTFPSQIRGGPTWTQTRISTEEVLSSGDKLDVLVAFNEYAYENHKEDVADDGVIVFNRGEFEIEGMDNTLGMDFDDLAKQTGNNRAANFVVMGAIAQLVDLPLSVLKEFNKKKYTRGRPSDKEIIDSNDMALDLGSKESVSSGLDLGELEDPIRPDGEQILVNGNLALSLGAAKAGLDVFVGYPISPATPILLWMEQNLVGQGKFVYQSTSEIESITSIVGASYAGKKAMTSTAGPGFTLMGEGIGLAYSSWPSYRRNLHQLC
jgi:2-oxoglutarate ferredoxin oxidoreductase subunit alpha